MLFEYSLTFFAEGQGGEKTEPATAKKLSDARKEGQVAKSKEIANCLALAKGHTEVFGGIKGADFF